MTTEPKPCAPELHPDGTTLGCAGCAWSMPYQAGQHPPTLFERHHLLIEPNVTVPPVAKAAGKGSAKKKGAP